jgi:hypothetical protein
MMRGAARTLPGEEFQFRPVRHVVAYGRTTNPFFEDGAILARTAGAVTSASTRRFGLVGSYDGDSVGLGRVVVDSTWHHWFSYNLHGFVNDGPDIYYQRMQYYYRNIGVWLATPAQRQAMLYAAGWGLVISDPMAFPLGSSQSLWAAGRRAQDVMARTISPSMLLELVSSFFSGRGDEIFGVPHDFDESAPQFATIPAGLAVRAMVGGIVSSFKQPASDYLIKGGARRLLNPEAISRYAVEGVKQGHAALRDALRSFADGSKDVIGPLEEAFQPGGQAPIAVDLVELKVVAERLQFPDPTDPALAGRGGGRKKRERSRTSISFRVAINGAIVSRKTVTIEVPSFRAEGACIELDQLLYEGVIQSQESLTVEVVAGEAGEGPVDGERVRFTDTMEGNLSRWVGMHTPSPGQAWRLWYRVESTNKGPTLPKGKRVRGKTLRGN